MPDEPKKTEEEKKEEKPAPFDHLVESKHAITIDGNDLKYTVVTGTMVLKEETSDRDKEAEGEKPKAQVFFTAYTKDDVRDKFKRPVTFSFNGGPGSSSAWMSLCAGTSVWAITRPGI